jgi:hypothetical protein
MKPLTNSAQDKNITSLTRRSGRDSVGLKIFFPPPARKAWRLAKGAPFGAWKSYQDVGGPEKRGQ